MRRFRLSSILPALAFALAPHLVSAQAYPSRPLEMVVHTAPGGGTDQIARVVAEIMTREKIFQQPINISNKPGGGGAIAYTYIKSKRGDPHVVMTVASMAMLSQVVRPELGLGLENYTPVAMLAQDPQAVMVAADAPFKTVKDLLETARREPNSLSASITSPGGTGRLVLWLFERESGARMKAVSFKSGADAILQVAGGHTQVTTENLSEGYSLFEAKKIRVLAVTSKTRLPNIPQLPTLVELGYNIHVGTERGFAMAAGVPRETVARMEAALKRVYETPAWKEHAERSMYENSWMGSAEYTKHLAGRRVLVQEFLQSIGLAPKAQP